MWTKQLASYYGIVLPANEKDPWKVLAAEERGKKRAREALARLDEEVKQKAKPLDS